MSATLARRPDWYFVPTPVEPPDTLGLGTCVRLSLSRHLTGGRSEEGVVIEVVQPGEPPRSARVAFVRTPTAPDVRYVIQCWDRRVLRRGEDLEVQAL